MSPRHRPPLPQAGPSTSSHCPCREISARSLGSLRSCFISCEPYSVLSVSPPSRAEQPGQRSSESVAPWSCVTHFPVPVWPRQRCCRRVLCASPGHGTMCKTTPAEVAAPGALPCPGTGGKALRPAVPPPAGGRGAAPPLSQSRREAVSAAAEPSAAVLRGSKRVGLDNTRVLHLYPFPHC